MAPTVKQQWLVIEGDDGVNVAPTSTPLTRLNYFDGKFLRAADLKLEQDAQRSLVHLSNVAVGFGPVYGMSLRLGEGDLLLVDPGQALDSAGHVLLLQREIEISAAEIIALSLGGDPPGSGPKSDETKQGSFEDCVLAGSGKPAVIGQDDSLWLITIAHAEFLCGEEEVYGKLCEDACITSTDRPFRVEGVVLRARPFAPQSDKPSSSVIPLTSKHLRSRVASAYFEDERDHFASFISASGLQSAMWCCGAELPTGEVALGVLARRGASNLWVDAWIVRRERIEAPPRMYWAHRMAMRPWREFIAQVIQFQCQLPGALVLSGGDGGAGPCADEAATIDAARDKLGGLLAAWLEAAGEFGGTLGAQTITDLQDVLASLGPDDEVEAPSGERVLIDGGIVELPPGGWLPIALNSDETVNEQVRRLLGEGVDLRFCVVRPDDVPRELEGVQHLDRISLLRGYDDPGAKPPVDILVPDGVISSRDIPVEGLYYAAQLTITGEPGGGGKTEDEAEAEPGDYISEANDFELDNPFIKKLLGYLEKLFGNDEIDPKKDVQPGFSVALTGAARLDRTPGGGGQCYFAGAHVIGYGKQGFGKQGFGKQGFGIPDAGVWIEARCESNLFESPLFTKVPTAMRLSGVLAPQSFVELVVSGSATPTTRQLHADTLVVEGSFEGFEQRADGQSGTTAQSKLSVYKATFVATRELTGSKAGHVTLTIHPKPPNDDHAVLAHAIQFSWQAEAIAGNWVVTPESVEGNEDEPVALTSQLTLDPEVVKTENLDHQAAIMGIAIVAGSKEDPAFADESSRLLFPPPPEAGGELIVAPTLDWVFFHARHRRICELEPAAAPQAVGRRYRVFHVAFESADEATSLGADIAGGDPIPADLELVEIGVVEYAPGIPALTTPEADITSAWQPHGSGAELVWTGIANQPGAASEGEVLTFVRLYRLEEVIEKTSPAIEQQRSELLAEIPGGVDPGDADGVILLFTGGAAGLLTCHSVIWLNPAKIGKHYGLELIEHGRLEELMQELDLEYPRALELGSVAFNGANATDELDAIVSAWNDHDPHLGTPLAVVAGAYTIDNPQSGTPDLRKVQREQIAMGFAAGSADGPEYGYPELPTNCPIMTFLQPRSVHIHFRFVTYFEGELVKQLLEERAVQKIIDHFTDLLDQGDAWYCFDDDISFHGPSSKNAEVMHPGPVGAFVRPGAKRPPLEVMRSQVAAGFKVFNVDYDKPIDFVDADEEWTIEGETSDVIVILFYYFG